MKVLTNNKYYSQIANVIREQNGTSNTYTPPQMVSALKDLFYEEVEGVPPISFNGIGEDLLDYRIDGASGGVGDRTENLFDSNINVISGYLSDEGILKPAKETSQITFDYIPIISGTYTFTYTVPLPSAYELWFSVCTYDESRTFQSRLVSEYSGAATFTIPDTTKYIRISLRGYNETPIIMLNSGSTALLYEPYGYKVPVVVSGKNLFNGELLQGYYTDSTMSTLASKNSNYKSIKIYLKKGKYTLSSNINLLIIRFITSQVYQSNPLGSNLTKTFTFEIENDGYISLAFRNENNQTWDNSTNLQIEIGDTATTYEEYTSPTITTIYLDSPILENESISLSDTNTNIQTVRGTNILTVDTTVQPSKVYVKSRKESSHEAQIRQLYESVNAELTQYKAQYGELGGE